MLDDKQAGAKRDVMNMNRLRLASFNVRGYETRAKLMLDLFELQDLHVLAIQETLIRNTADRMHTHLQCGSVTGGDSFPEARGTAMLIKLGIEYSLVCKE